MDIRLSRLDQHGAIGENFTIEGTVENQVFVGDVWKISDVELEVTAPREPCFKFNAIMGDRLAGKKMFSQGLCGWYFSVRNPGSLRAGASIEIFPGPRKRSIAGVFESLAKKTDDVQKKYFSSYTLNFKQCIDVYSTTKKFIAVPATNRSREAVLSKERSFSHQELLASRLLSSVSRISCR